MRQRRDTVRTRAVAATAVFTFLVGIVILGRFQGWRHRAAAQARTAATLAPVAPPAADQLTSLPPPDPVQAAAAAPESPAGHALDECTDAVAHRLLRTAAEACAEAFAAQPSDAGLAMKVAKVQHARGQYRDAGEWAGRAIALHTTDADAFVILAHAEARARHPAAARAAYRKYLALAPRGWHASEARRALRPRAS